MYSRLNSKSNSKSLSQSNSKNLSRSTSSTIGIAEIINTEKNLEEIKVFVTTWNMGNAEPNGFRNIFQEKNALKEYDIFAIGLQESTFHVKGLNTPGSHDSIHHFHNYIQGEFSEDEFFVVEHCYRAQLQLYLIAKKKFEGRIQNVETCIENTGFLHVFPNKGGLLVSFSVDGTRLAFISCHLTAHEGVEHCEQRNASIVEILGGVRAGDKNIDITEQFHHVFWMGDMNYRLTFDSKTPANSKKNIDILTNSSRKVTTIRRPDEVTIDLADNGNRSQPEFEKGNDGDESSSEEEGEEDDTAGIPAFSSDKKREWDSNRKRVLDLIAREQWKELLQYDELNREIEAKRVLNDFIALQPSFPPTFKRIRGEIIRELSPFNSHSSHNNSHKWDLHKSNGDDHSAVKVYYHKKRIPSYTDRILYKSLDTFQGFCRPIFFESCEAAISSDHKPVRAGFTLKLVKGNEEILVDRQLLGKVKKPAESRNKEPKLLKLQIFDLKGIELEEMDSQIFGGGSDPYIVITTDPPNLLLYKNRICLNPPRLKSKVIKHNINPIWPDPMYVNLASTDLEGLSRNASLIFQVWDEDISNPDDLIGCVTIPLKEILISLFVDRRPFVFEKYLRSNSELMGRLSGRIILDGDYVRTEDDARIIAREKENASNPNFISLNQALLEATSADSIDCCTIN